jgi:DNA-binding CsgD family transcriptional regulator
MNALCRIELGQFEHAAGALSLLDNDAVEELVVYPLLLDARAQLRLAEHRPQDALEDATQAGLVLASGPTGGSPGAVPWRSTAALAHLALGEPERARMLAEAELEEARRIGITRVAIRDLRIVGLSLGGDAGLRKLAQAVAAGDSEPTRLQQARALVDLGAALRRGNRRIDARAPLRRGLDLSHRGGASLLEERARTELIATGARPRRAAASGVDSLTVSQRRVAELAASGLTTRQIAEALFVTPKTVEFHLRQTYRKLDVASRDELAASLKAV